MAAPKAQFPDGAADVARRFGLSVKALKIYEEMGLLSPMRTQAGWRIYGQAACERIHVICSLRQLGLSLAEIADIDKSGEADMDALLGLREDVILKQRGKLDESLSLIRKAREKIRAGEHLDIESLANLVRRSRIGKIEWSPKLKEIADRVFSSAQRQRLTKRISKADDEAWADIYAELVVLAPKGDAKSAAASKLARRAITLIRRVAGGDRKNWMALLDFWRAAFAEPKVRKSLPMSEGEWNFLRQAISHRIAQDGVFG